MSIARVVGKLRHFSRLNGPVWTAQWGAYVALQKASAYVSKRMIQYELERGLPGLYPPDATATRRRWDAFDWSEHGEQWTDQTPGYKVSAIRDIACRYIADGATILEIAPGAGRWTEGLLQFAGRLILVDISERCIDLCRQRFAGHENVEYHVNDGRSLEFLPDGSVDAIWSFESFICIHPLEIAAYVRQFPRILKPGGVAVIHHSNLDLAARKEDVVESPEEFRQGTKRTRMTASAFAHLVRKSGLTLERQFDTWGDHGKFSVRNHRDVISVVRKASALAAVQAALARTYPG